MYITHNNQTYANIRVYSTSGSVRFTGESLSGLSELTGEITVYADNGFAMQSFAPGDFLRQEIQDGNWMLTNTPLPTPQPVVATPVAYDLNTSTAFAVKLLMSEKKPETADEIIKCSSLWDEWETGKNTVDEIFTVPLKFFMETTPEKHDTVWKVVESEDFPYDKIEGGKNYPFSKGKTTQLFYEYDGHTIWGFTAQVIQNIIEILKTANA